MTDKLHHLPPTWQKFQMSPAKIWFLLTPDERKGYLSEYIDGDHIDPNTPWMDLPYWFTHAWGWSIEFKR